MPSRKRPPLSFPELDHRGAGAILRSAEEVHTEEAMLARQQTGMPAENDLGGVAGEAATETPASTSRTLYPKATYRLRPATLEAIDDAKRILRRQYGIKVSLEDIAEEAIMAAYTDLMENQQTSMLAIQLASKQASRRSG
jgi:hypothetical protein